MLLRQLYFRKQFPPLKLNVNCSNAFNNLKQISEVPCVEPFLIVTDKFGNISCIIAYLIRLQRHKLSAK
ncbi:hypothetical protein H5410_057000, partial [Solanum commersonii]